MDLSYNEMKELEKSFVRFANTKINEKNKIHKKNQRKE